MRAFVLHNDRGQHGIKSSDRLVQVLRAEAKAGLASIREMGEDLAGMGQEMIKHAINVATHQAFTIAGRSYRVAYQLVPSSGQVILVRFRLHVI